MSRRTRFQSLFMITSIHSSLKSRTVPQEMYTLSSVPAVSQMLNCFVEISHDKQKQMCKHIQGDTFPKQQIIIGNMAATVLINHD